MKIVFIELIVIFLFLCGNNATAVNINKKIPTSEAIAISISPEFPTYGSNSYYDVNSNPLIENFDSIKFIITIRNNSLKPITIIHPRWTLPGGVPRNSTKIRLIITKPDGECITIREHNLVSSFDLGNFKTKIILRVSANKEVSFIGGKFFKTAMPQWEEASKYWKLFSEIGTYKVKVIFRNIYPKATFYKEASGKYDNLNVWTGELKSNEAVVKIL